MTPKGFIDAYDSVVVRCTTKIYIVPVITFFRDVNTVLKALYPIDEFSASDILSEFAIAPLDGQDPKVDVLDRVAQHWGSYKRKLESRMHFWRPYAVIDHDS